MMAVELAGMIRALAPDADPETIEQAVAEWLNDHPEAVAPIDDTAGEGDTDKIWSADKTAGEVATLTEAITELDGFFQIGETVTLTNLVQPGAAGWFGTSSALVYVSSSDGIETYKPKDQGAGYVTSPYMLNNCSLGEGKYVAGFKYRITKVNPSVGDPSYVRIHLGTDNPYDSEVVYDQWVTFNKTVTKNVTRVRFALNGYETAPTKDDILVEIKELYVYRVGGISDDLLSEIIQKQDTNYQVNTATYGITSTGLDTTLTRSDTVPDSKSVGDAIRPWNGKSVVLFGDSIMYNDGHNNIVGYPHYVAECGFSTVTNKGKDGACVAYHSERSSYEDICTTVDNVTFTGYDLAIIAGGINDFNVSSASPIGTLINSTTIGDFTKTDFIGALQYIITKILTAKPSIKIMLMTPLKKTGWYTANSQSKVLKDYADAIKEVAEYYSIPVLDFYADSGINRMNFSTFLSDGLHPNNDGYMFVSEKLKSFINGI